MRELSRITWLISVPENERSSWRIIAWWEARRIPYNLIVGLGGALGLLLYVWFNTLPPKLAGPSVDPLAVILFGVGANFFYTAGWIGELIARPLWPEKTRILGPQLLILGTLLSLMLAFFPALASLIGWAWRAIS